MKSEWERIHMNKQWYSGNFSSTKAPTAMLLHPNETFYAFGYEAENRYSDLVEDDPFDDEEKRDKKKKDEYYFFQRFKDILYKQVSSILNISRPVFKISQSCQCHLGNILDYSKVSYVARTCN